MRRITFAIAGALLVGACSTEAIVAEDGGAGSDASVDSSAPPAPTTTADTGAPPPDSAVAVDAAPEGGPTVADYYELGTARTVPQVVECRPGAAYVISGRAANRTGFTFYFQTMPAAGTYTIETVPAGTPPNLVPASPTGVLARYSSDPQGGTSETYDATSGTVTVSLVGGKLRAVGTAIPARERTSSATGTVAAQLTCP